MLTTRLGFERFGTERRASCSSPSTSMPYRGYSVACKQVRLPSVEPSRCVWSRTYTRGRADDSQAGDGQSKTLDCGSARVGLGCGRESFEGLEDGPEGIRFWRLPDQRTKKSGEPETGKGCPGWQSSRFPEFTSSSATPIRSLGG